VSVKRGNEVLAAHYKHAANGRSRGIKAMEVT
jgi:hypothetical protein